MLTWAIPRLPASTVPVAETLAARESFSAAGATKPGTSFSGVTEPIASLPFVTAPGESSPSLWRWRESSR